MSAFSMNENAALHQAAGTAPQAQLARVMDDMAWLWEERNSALAETARTQNEAMLRLTLAASYKDDDTSQHVVRIGLLAERLALLMGERPGFARLLRKAAPMHDIGKIGVPDAILQKAGPLTPEERRVMQRHASIGERILGGSRSPLFRMASEVAGAHHERFDGSGYPRALVGEAIPLSARIVAVVDFFDALLMDRPHRAALPRETVRTMVADEVGRAFDPRVAETLLAQFDALWAVRAVMVMDGLTVADLIERVHHEPVARDEQRPVTRAQRR